MSVKLAALALSLLGAASAGAAEARLVAALEPAPLMESPAALMESNEPTANSDDAAAAAAARARDIAQSPFGELALRPSKVPVIDESALRYYAAQKDRKRVEAEIRRIKSRFPRWTPPVNLYTSAGTGEGEQPLWDLFGAG